MAGYSLAEFKEKSEALCQNIGKAIMGKDDEIRLVAAALFAGGHVLLDDVPGTGKTVLAKSLAKSLTCGFGRVQFTPDLLPSELTGINIYSPKTGDFSFRRGSLFTNILLADEINRATPRTQAGLLESMEERQVTVDGVTYPLERPYFVIATQNPVETKGTFPLPEAQQDRFMLCLSLGYPTREESANILKSYITGAPAEALGPVLTAEDLLEMQKTAAGVYIHDEVYRYIVRLAEATREHSAVALGVSTRGCLAMGRLAQSRAAMQARGFVTPDDVKQLLPNVFGHRLMLRGGAGLKGADAILAEIAADVEAPVEDWENKVQAAS